MRGTVLLVLIGMLAACTSSPPHGGTLKIVVIGADGQVHVTGPRLDTRVTRDQELRGLDPGRYVLGIEPVRVPDGTRYPLDASVEVVVPAGGAATAEANYGVLVPDTTKVLDPGQVLDAGQPTLVLATAGLVPGQILVAGAGPKTPQGLLRKVTAVRTVAAGVSVDTEPATLADAIPVGEISLRQQTFGSATVHNGRGRTGNGDIAAVFPFAGCAGRVTGGIQLTWTPSVDLDWKWAKLPTRVDKATFTVESTRFLGGTYSAGANASCVFDVSQPNFVGTIELMLGPVPVLLSATAQLTSHSQLEAIAGASYSFDSTDKLTLGVAYQNGKLDPFSKLERPNSNTSKNLDLSTRIGVRFGLSVDELAGPYLDLTFDLRGRSDVLCTGVSGDLGWELAALGLPDLRAPEFADSC